jgi:hypothetical protein
MLDTYPTPTRTVAKCLVCGCSEIHTDAVEDRGWVLLAECSRCDHRWTARVDSTEPMVARVPSLHPGRSVRRVERPARVAREVASAA